MYFMSFSSFSFQTTNIIPIITIHLFQLVATFPFLHPSPEADQTGAMTGSRKGIHQLRSPAIQELWKNLDVEGTKMPKKNDEKIKGAKCFCLFFWEN